MRALGRVVRWTALVVAGGSLAGALVLTLLRVSDPSWSRLVELAAFTPAALPLALVGAVTSAVLLAAWTRRGVERRTWRRWALGGTIAGLVMGMLHAWWLAPLYTGDTPPAAPGDRLVVMAQNLEYGDGAALTRLVEDQHVDVLVLTDATSATLQATVDAGVRDALPFAVGIGPEGPQGSVVLSRHPVREVLRISDGGDSRIIALSTPTLGAIEVAALHPTPPYQAGKWSADYDQILAALSNRYGQRTERPVIIAGDLNATLDHAPLRSVQDMGFRDAAEQRNLGWLPTWPTGGLQQRLGITLPPLLPIDHVMTSPSLVVTDAAVSGLAGSDHRAVVATLAPAAGP